MGGKVCVCGQRSARAAAIRVLLVDDNWLIRTSMAEVLSNEADVTVVGECEDGAQVVEAAARLRPDVVLMDLSMPVMNGLAATEALRAARSRARVIIFTGSGALARSQAEAAGAHALVPKGTTPEEVLDCVRSVAHGCTDCACCL